MPNVEYDPFGLEERDKLEKEAKDLLGDLRIGKTSPFSYGNEEYHRTVEHFSAATLLNERWLRKGSTVTRGCIFVGRVINQTTISYPAGQRYDPRIDFSTISLDFRNGQTSIARKALNQDHDYDKAIFNQGVFSSFTLADGQEIARKAEEAVNEVVIVTQGRERINYAHFPYRFDLARLGHLILGNPFTLRDTYYFQYSCTPKSSRSGKAFDPRLLTDHPAGQACLNACLTNGWLPSNTDVVRLVKLWDEVKEGRRSEGRLPSNRLEFARWLVQHGRISEDLASQ